MRLRLPSQTAPLLATALVCGLLYAAACWRYTGFFSTGVAINLIADNAFLGLAAVGMTFVILSGGIDLSVGAMIGLGSIVAAMLIERAGIHPAVAATAILAGGAAFGAGMGGLIHWFRLPPFLVTLAGMFLARGAAFAVSLDSVTIRHEAYRSLSVATLGGLPLTAVIFLAAVAAAMYVAHFTPFGRVVYAVGGSESSAELMGLPVASTRVAVYALSGLCSAGAGLVYTLYTSSGNASAGTMLELDAIAVVVIGGTLLSGGVGTVLGTLLGVVIYGTIQTAIIFEGTLNSWWTRIAVGGLLLLFILLQKLVQQRAARWVG